MMVVVKVLPQRFRRITNILRAFCEAKAEILGYGLGHRLLQSEEA